jgi:hypothetical protein
MKPRATGKQKLGLGYFFLLRCRGVAFMLALGRDASADAGKEVALQENADGK